jgi:hypothetical protein
LPLWLAAWALAGPAGFGLLGLYVARDNLRRAQSLYTPQTWVPIVYWAAVVVALGAVGVAAFRIATMLASQ